MKPFKETYEDYIGEINLNLGSGRNLEAGFVNLDKSPNVGADVVHDLETRLPFPSSHFDCVVASHVLEHIRDLMGLMGEVHRVLKPEGYFIAVTPHMGSDDAWEDPTHVRAFSERSWMYFDQRIYKRNGHHGSYDPEMDYTFEVDNVWMIPYPEWKDATDEEIDKAKHKYRNVVSEIHAILKKGAL
jgi:SAM-dependent methyltransferase